MATFENPTNGYREEVTGVAGVWAFLFGLLYFLAKGAWTHAAIQLVLIVLSIGLLGAGGVAVMVVVWIGYAFAAPSILKARYRRQGWREVGSSLPSPGYINAERQTPSAAPSKVVDTRECPRCAETIKRAAKVCRFCGADLSSLESKRTAQSGVAAETPPSALDGLSVTHKNFGVGFVVREAEPGKLLVRFESGHQVVRELDVTKINLAAPDAGPSTPLSGQPVKHPLYGRGYFLRAAEESGQGIARFVNGDRVVALADLEVVAGNQAG